MKIAIMTQPLGPNYGGMIQAYALQQVLLDMGHEVLTINRKAPTKTTSLFNFSLFLVSRTIKKVLGMRKAPIFFERQAHKILENTQNFIDANILLSEELTSTNQLSDFFEKNSFDVIIVGSDQVWRKDYSPNIFNFYFDILEGKSIKRLSYAASFGFNKWTYSEEETKRCRDLIKSFDAVSVREKDAIELCRTHLDCEAQWVCDPTLLLNKTRYLKLIEGFSFDINGSLFYYLLDKSQEKVGLVERIADKYKYTTYSCYSKRNHLDTQGTSIDDYKLPYLEQWLSSFYHAKLVITDSFHGVVFSIIFEKPFFVFINEERGASRFNSLIEIADFSDRIIDINTDINSVVNNPKFRKPVVVNDSIIKRSKEFLINSLSS